MDNVNRVEPDWSGDGLRVGVVVARFNEEVTSMLESSCLQALSEHGVLPQDITVFSVPGALEIPLVLAQAADTGRFDALIALGAVIRGETYHFEVVSNESCAGVSRVSLDHRVPVANGILTTEDDDQAFARAEEKGRDCALAAIEMANLIFAIDEQTVEEDARDD
ncbi:MAG: 6,7-dimethyl-8-ribityllumazine synthase [Burkholderiaceae bacterium]|jgi:6,7-dimethyl-8-ribityllumazine synthase